MNCILIDKPRRSIIYDTSVYFPNTESTPTSVPSLFKSVSCNTTPAYHHRRPRLIKTIESFHPSEEEIKSNTTKTHVKAVAKTKLKANKATLVKRPRIFVNKQKPLHHNCTCVDCLCKGTNVRKSFNEENENHHASDCICVSCLTNDGDAKEVTPPQHGIDCSCVECLYLCEGMKNQTSDDSLHNSGLSEDYHPADCECPTCLTSPESPIKLPLELNMHDSNCGCVNCVFNKNQLLAGSLHGNQEKIRIDKSSVCLEVKKSVPKTTKSAGQMAIIISKNNKEIIEILDKIRSACKEAEQLKRCNSADRQKNLENTLGTLQRTFEKLQFQCKHMNSNVNCLKTQLLEEATSDNNDHGDKNIREVHSECNTNATNKYKQEKESVQEEIVNNPDEMEVTEARRISSNSLLLFWTPGKFTQEQIGYEILVNGLIKSRVYSSFRTCAVLHDLDFKSNAHISIYAVSAEGRLQPPARALFEV